MKFETLRMSVYDFIILIHKIHEHSVPSYNKIESLLRKFRLDVDMHQNTNSLTEEKSILLTFVLSILMGEKTIVIDLYDKSNMEKCLAIITDYIKHERKDIILFMITDNLALIEGWIYKIMIIKDEALIYFKHVELITEKQNDFIMIIKSKYNCDISKDNIISFERYGDTVRYRIKDKKSVSQIFEQIPFKMIESLEIKPISLTDKLKSKGLL